MTRGWRGGGEGGGEEEERRRRRGGGGGGGGLQQAKEKGWFTGEVIDLKRANTVPKDIYTVLYSNTLQGWPSIETLMDSASSCWTNFLPPDSLMFTSYESRPLQGSSFVLTSRHIFISASSTSSTSSTSRGACASSSRSSTTAAAGGSVPRRPCLRSSLSWMKLVNIWVSMNTSRKRLRLLDDAAGEEEDEEEEGLGEAGEEMDSSSRSAPPMKRE
ncbi:hypothetical protein EYF80_013728 [Liparis tanakae]|uniref:Uncharacterized protein n=1 Tax=Liparis tanakae TaxID=230148 RepID=A0A4Z2IEH1_9TELE|nr:hypothetical protein EYF80_013728 [Liparis tanakae]